MHFAGQINHAQETMYKLFTGQISFRWPNQTVSKQKRELKGTDANQ